MAYLAGLVVAATTVLAAAPPPPALTAMDPVAVVQLSFRADLDTFLAARARHTPPDLDWSSDGCSTPFPIGLGDTGRSFDFRGPCQRHDFGYRNHKLLDRRPGEHGWWWNEQVRRRIDDRMFADMLTVCARKPWTQRAACRTWAAIYHRAVRVGGR